MKIIHVCLGTPGSHSMVGVLKSVHRLAAAQHKLGLDTEVWGIGPKIKRIDKQAGYRFRSFYSFKYRFFAGVEMKEAIKGLARDTLAHLHSVFIPENYTTGRLLKIKGIPWVISPEGGYNKEVFARRRIKKNIYFYIFDLWLIKHAKALHAVGASDVKDFKRLAPKKSFVLIPNGQDLDELQYRGHRVESSTRPIFCFCGRLDAAHKGLDLLLQGFTRYRLGGGSGVLWLIGDEEDKRLLQRMARDSGIAEYVFFFGALYGEEKLRHISTADVYSLTSRWEGMPHSALEAAGLARPLLISRATNLGELVKKYQCGFVLAKNTSQEIATVMHKVDKLYKDQELSRMGDNALKMVEKECNWEHIARRMVDELYS